MAIDPLHRNGEDAAVACSLRDRLLNLEEEHGAVLAALDRAREDADRLQARIVAEARRSAEAIDRLRGELRQAQALAASLGALQADSLRLREVATLLGGAPSVAAQHHGFDVLQRSLRGQIAAWMAEAARDRTELLLLLEAEVRHRNTVMGSTSWRLTGPLRRIGRATQVIRREPHRVPSLLVRTMRRPTRTASPSAVPPAAGPSAAPSAQADALAATASRIDGELTTISELLQTLSAALAGRGGAGFRPAAAPGSAPYRAMTHAGKLATWIRHDAARRSDTAT